MSLTSLIQDAGSSSAGRGTNVLLFLAVVIVGLIYLSRRRRGAPTTPMLPPSEARSALARAKSPFSWLPILFVVALFILQVINDSRG